MTHSATPRLPGRLPASLLPVRSEGGLLALLLTLLVAANWLFVGSFVLGATGAGLCAAVVIRQWHTRHPSPLPDPSRSRVPEINLSAIPVGGDTAGLVFAVGSVVVVIVGLPGIAWYLLGVIGCALLVAGALFAARSARAWQPLRGTSLGRL